MEPVDHKVAEVQAPASNGPTQALYIVASPPWGPLGLEVYTGEGSSKSLPNKVGYPNRSRKINGVNMGRHETWVSGVKFHPYKWSYFTPFINWFLGPPCIMTLKIQESVLSGRDCTYPTLGMGLDPSLLGMGLDS